MFQLSAAGDGVQGAASTSTGSGQAQHAYLVVAQNRTCRGFKRM